MSDRRFQQASQELAEDLAALRDDVSKLTRSVSDLVRGRANDAAEQASGLFGRARSRANEARDEAMSRAYDARDRVADQASHLQDRLGERLGSWGGEVETKIERNPLTAVIVAGIAGLLLGLMSRSL